MNETIRTMLERRSIRRYKPDPIPDDILASIIEAGISAPSGRNIQTPVIVAAQNKDEIDALSKANAAVMGSTNDPFYGAPVVLIVL
ncbi:MAG: nitroreductase family protein, partial [Clostridia bacterium]|nr:nitroreductase family protein [Clostridia bacterium]